MKDPFIYYRLDQFYNNYRSFVKSRDNYQLKGKLKTLEETKKCLNAKSYADLLHDKWLNGAVTPYMKQNTDKLAYPCGMIAKYFFNDIFKGIRATDNSFAAEIDDSNIAFPADVNSKFKVNEEALKNRQYYRNVTDPHFMVWY